MKKFEDLHLENDKIFAPFLLAASFNGLVEFVGFSHFGNKVYLEFFPKTKALTLISKLQTKSEPAISAQDLFHAIEVFWKEVSKARNEGIKNGVFG